MGDRNYQPSTVRAGRQLRRVSREQIVPRYRRRGISTPPSSRTIDAGELARIVLRPSAVELGTFREQYDGLVAELETQGLDVELVAPEEYRSGLPDPDSLYNVSVYVGQVAGTLLSEGVLVGTLRKHLRGRLARSRARRGCIVFPDGQKHEFRLPEE